MALTFQELVENLNRYWADQGCVIQFPYDIEKGASTMNPATFLRVLGPEPWNVGNVDPADARRTAATEKTPTACSIISSTRSS